MSKNFSAQVDEWVRRSQKRIDRVMKTAVMNLIEDAQTPVAKGGRMRVDTGFLRASGQVSLTGVPTGPSRPPRDGETVAADDASASVSIANAQAGQPIWFGWTANYAKYRESYDGFLGIALQNWQRHVDAAVRKVKQSDND